MPTVNDLFTLAYGHSLELNRLTPSSRSDAINFVGRAARNNGVTARVDIIQGLPPALENTITVALNGQGGAGVAYVQPRPYYTGFHVMVLTPRVAMTEQELLWWATCITANRFRFGFGRQANRTLKDLLLPAPDKMPEWVNEVDFRCVFKSKLTQFASLSQARPVLQTSLKDEDREPVGHLFDVQLGTNLELLRLDRDKDGVNFVSRTAKNNGITARVARLSAIAPTPGGVISVAAGGSVLETFVQFDEFYSGRDLFVLAPKSPMSAEELLFYATCIRENQFRYSYGRQANRTLKELAVPARSVIPEWVYGVCTKIAGQLIKAVNA